MKKDTDQFAVSAQLICAFAFAYAKKTGFLMTRLMMVCGGELEKIILMLNKYELRHEKTIILHMR